MPFQAAPPDTSGYMIAGYAVFFVISAIYLVSLIVRQRNLERDLETLESIEAESKGKVSGPRAEAGSASAARAVGSTTRPRTAQRKKVTRRK